MQLAARTDVGHVRARNEDALLVDRTSRVIGVFDGLGGHPAGDVASLAAVERIREALRGGGSAADLADLLRSAHESVVAAAEEDSARDGMATTAVLARLDDGSVTVAHVGDSRAYLLLPGSPLQQITDDHGMGGYITQALGLDRVVRPDVVTLAAPAGTRLLLCSDGLSNLVDAQEIADLLGTGDAEAACDALVEAALAHGGIDNVTVVIAVLS